MTSIETETAKGIRIRDIENLKYTKTLRDISGERPVTVSVVIPTFNKDDCTYNRALQRVLERTCNLVDKGIVDEIVIAEGSRLEDGSPDYGFIEFILAVAMKHCSTFNNEVRFVQSMPEGRFKALQGRFDFSVRIMNQVDPDLHRIFLDRELLTRDELEVLKQGKGAKMWCRVPVT